MSRTTSRTILTASLGGPLAALLMVCCSVAPAADTWRDATVLLSDGNTLEGQVSFVNDQLILHNEAQKRKYTIRPDEIRLIETLLEKESMEKKWIFKEDGRDEKVYTGETYPVRYYSLRVTFHDGRTLEGHIIGQVLNLKSGGKVERVFLKRKDEGPVGGKLTDLVYVKSIAFKGQVGAGVLGTISGMVRLPEGERLLRILAIHLQNDFSIEATLSPGGRFRFTDCTAGTYDLVVVSDKAVYVWFSAEKAEGAGRFDAAVLKEIADWAKNVREFFHAQDPIYGAGNKDRAYVLVRLERHGQTSLKGAELVRRYEAWLMHKPVDEWQIQKRFYLSRELTGKQDDPRERIVICPLLGGHAVGAERREVVLELDLTKE